MVTFQVCNTNPVPDTSAQKNERIAQLLASWGIYFNDTSTNNTSSHTNRKKRQVNQDAFDGKWDFILLKMWRDIVKFGCKL